MLAAFVLGSRRATICREILVTQRLSGIVCKYLKKPKILFDFPVLHSKAILLQVVIFFRNNAKKPWFKEWRIAFRRKRINQKRHQMFQIPGEKKHHLKLLNIARIEETCIHLA